MQPNWREGLATFVLNADPPNSSCCKLSQLQVGGAVTQQWKM